MDRTGARSVETRFDGVFLSTKKEEIPGVLHLLLLITLFNMTTSIKNNGKGPLSNIE